MVETGTSFKECSSLGLQFLRACVHGLLTRPGTMPIIIMGDDLKRPALTMLPRLGFFSCYHNSFPTRSGQAGRGQGRERKMPRIAPELWASSGIRGPAFRDSY